MLCGLVMKAENGRLSKIAEIPAGNSIAAVYGSVTDLMGMKINEHEYKIMGLSPYTSEHETNKVYPLFDNLIKVTGTQIKSMFGMRAGYMYLQRNLINKRFDGIAGAAQKMVEDKITQWIQNVINKEDIHSLVLGGGLFMNVKANKIIGEMEAVHELSVCPSAADESNAIGAAYWGYEQYCDNNAKEYNPEPLDNLYLGPEFSDEEISKVISQLDQAKFTIEHTTEVEKRIAKLLSEGHIVARMSGRCEFGARALGNRSILADARNPEVIRVINEQIKNRDFWMPFASSILAERVGDYLINPKKLQAPFMILAFDTTDLGKEHLKGAIHPYDFTSRPQIVTKEASPKYYSILKEFETITGVGGILNTSFNLHGEPVVLTPQDAINTFLNSGLQIVALENFLVIKKHE
jgi:carbamoyltransferase